MSGPLCCLGALPQPHWVPDGHALCCSSCGATFSFLLRRHHCRCCGAVFCESCSSHRTAAPGWGFEHPVRVCDECHALETRHLPLLLAGNVFAKPGEGTGQRHRRYLRLSHDQVAVLWSPWRDDEGADAAKEKSALVSQLTCASMSKGSRNLVCRAPRARQEQWRVGACGSRAVACAHVGRACGVALCAGAASGRHGARDV